MASNVAKSLNQAPAGLPEQPPMPDDSGEIELPGAGPSNVTENDDGSVTVDLSGLPAPVDPKMLDHDANLAEHMSEEDLNRIAGELIADFDDDLQSRSEWEKTYKEGLKLLGLRMDERTEPWEGACGIVHPILSEAIIRFQAEMITETFPAAGPVKTKILGQATPDKEAAAERVREDMNIELTDRMTEYRPEHERLLWNLPAAGSALKKVYYDPTLGRQTAMFVPAEDFVVSYGASDLATCTRYTHVMKKTPNEVQKLIVAGFYRDVELSDPTPGSNDISLEKDRLAGQQSPGTAEHHTLYEMNVDLDLPGFEDPLKIDLPYVVTIDRDSQKVLSIRRNYEEKDPARRKRQYFVHYTYIPGFGFYGFGLIHLVGGFAEGATSLLRQLVDAGTLSNLPGGLKTRGLRIRGDDSPIGPGEWRDVDVPGGTLKENLMPLPYKEPSAVLAQLLDTIVEEGRKLAAVAEMQVSDFDANSPVGTTLALLERTLKVMTAVQSRVYEAMKLEFRLIKDIIRDFGTDKYEYMPESGDPSTKKSDYETVDVLPVADPNAATMSQRIVQMQAVMQMAAGAPQIYDLPELHGQMLDVMGIKNVDKLIPTRKGYEQPMDPVSENMAIMVGKPVKAYIYQDHMSHIQVHQMAMQDPKIQAMIGQNPMAQQIQAAAMAHLMEHLGFQYRAEMEQMLGQTLPPPDQPLPPQLEVQLSRQLVLAGQKLLGKDQNEVAAQQAQQAAQDPVLQQQQADTQVKQDEVRRKAQRDQWEKDVAYKKLLIDANKVDSGERVAGAKIGAEHSSQIAQQVHQANMQSDQHNAQQHQAAFTAVIDVGNQAADHAHQRQQQAAQHAHEKAQQAAAPKPTGSKE